MQGYFKGFYYECVGCSEDCIIRKAVDLSKRAGLDVYVLPGGSCIKQVLANGYDAVIGVACVDEIKMGGKYLEEREIPFGGIPLMKNGCSGTYFDIDYFKKFL